MILIAQRMVHFYFILSYDKLCVHGWISGDADFSCEDEVNEQPMTGPMNAQPDHCNQCRLAILWDTSKMHKILEYVAAHLLFNNMVDRALQLVHAGISPVCILQKGKGAGSASQIDMCTSHCPNLVSKFFYSAASTERISLPCTNVPVACPLCPLKSGCVWKYNMKTHIMNHHPSIQVHDTDILQAYIISESEKATLKLPWDKHHSVESCQKQNVASAFDNLGGS